ncbi:MAG TPA: NAD-dependent epimerase [Terriglobia bacterium]|nr:NAD-dependent epimerase [Terriglobia bacterium]
MKILVTGCAGFIGFHLCRRLLERGDQVAGLDNLNPYYDVTLKEARLAQIASNPRFQFAHLDLADRQNVEQLFQGEAFDAVAHLAAQAGVRHSLKDPHAYADSNLAGFLNVLEGCRHSQVKHLVFASSSSVYGANTLMPFSTHHNVDHPVSLYAATKKANELMAHAYAHLYRLPCTGLRFFTVYGPWGRPDMALFLFTRAILAGEPIHVFNYGKMQRDFTYIDDIIEGVVRVMDRLPQPDPGWTGDHPDPATSTAPYHLYNIGNNQPVELMTLIGILESKLGKKAKLNLAPIQPGDVPATYADISDLIRDVGFKPQTPIEVGIERFVEWYREYFKVSCP